MFTDLPQNIQDALNLLWDYSDDACASDWPKDALDEEGYACGAAYGHYIRFVISRKEVADGE